MIVKLAWAIPQLRCIVTIEVNAADLQDAGEKAAAAIRDVAVPRERVYRVYPMEPTIAREAP
ncbi:MAG TPA: hypothetical protein VIW78_04935 [Burkholderiales bacterium]